MDIDCWLNFVEMQCPPQVAADDGRLRTGIHAEMAAATVLVNAEAIKGRTLGELGDYLAPTAAAVCYTRARLPIP